MRTLRWGEGAIRDLEEILQEIAAQDPLAAKRFLRGVREKVEGLTDFPLRGSPQPHLLRSPPPRRLIHGSYLIYYTVHRKELRIRASVHGARLFQRAWLRKR